MTAESHRDCPSDDELADFIAQAVDEASHAAIESHIADCASCRRFLADLAPVLDTEPPSRATTGEDEADLEARARALFSTLDRYVPTRLLGAGGMGIVYEGRDTVLDRAVALKMMLDAPGDVRQRLRSEAQTLAQLSHPSVVRIYDVELRDDAAVLIHELVDGRDLTTWIEEEPRGWAEIVAVLVGAAAGLEAAHRSGIVHRDVTPNNIVVDGEGVAKVIDFGLASVEHTESSPDSAADESGDAPDVTRRYGGTPGFVAPEVVGRRESGPAADQYGLCATAHFALFGRTPEAGMSASKTRTRDAVPPALIRVVARGLAEDPRDRFASMEALRRALEKASVRHPHRRWTIAGSMAAVVLATGVGALSTSAASRVVECDPSPHLLMDLSNEAALERIGTPGEGASRWETDAAEQAVVELRGWADRWQTEATRACRQGPSESDACLRRAANLYRDMLGRDFDGTTNLDLRMAELPPPEACATGLGIADVDGAQARALWARIARTRRLRADVRPAEARALVLDAAEQAEALDLPIVAAAAYQVAGSCSASTRETDEALAWQQRGYALAVEHGADGLAMSIALDLVLAESVRDNPTEAQRWLGVAEGLVEQHGGWQARVGLASRQARYEYQHGDSRRAVELAERALAIGERHGDPASHGTSLLRKNLGQMLVQAGQPERAEPLLLRAAEELERANQPQIAATAILHAGYIASQRHDEAATVHRVGESLRLTREAYGAESPRTLARTCDYGDALRGVGDAEGALRVLEPAVQRLTEIHGNGSANLVEPMQSLALAHVAAGNVDTARSILWRALAILDTNPGAAERLRPYLHQALGWAEQTAGNDAAAAKHYRQALDELTPKLGMEHPIVREVTASLREVEG